MKPALQDALARARLVRDGCGDREVGDDLASVWYAASAVVELASALELDEADIRGAAAAVAEACALPLPAARIILFGQAAGDPRLLELPPLLAAEIQLKLLLGLDVLAEVSLWKRTPGGLECILVARRLRRAQSARARRGEGRPPGPLTPVAPGWLEPPLRGGAPARRAHPRSSSAGSDRSSRRSRTPSSPRWLRRSARSSSASSSSSTPPRESGRSSAPSSAASCGSGSISTTAPSRTSSRSQPTSGSCSSRSIRSCSRSTASRRSAASTT